MGSLELVYDYLEDHARASAQVSERRPLALGLLSFLIGGLSFYVAQVLAGRVLLPFSWSSCALTLLWGLSAGFLLAGVLHLILEMQGIQGSAAGLFVQLGLAELSWTLAVPLVFLARLLLTRSSLVLTLVFLLVGALSLILKARGLQDNYRISAGRAWLTLSLPYLAAIGVLLLALSLAALEAFKLFR